MADDTSPQAVRTALVTGATSGLGLAAAIGLARDGYAVTLLGRDEGRLKAAVDVVRAAGGGSAEVVGLRVDLSDFDQVREATRHLRAAGRPLGLLINNAAIMAPPRLITSAAGYEMQLSVNHLAHHILVARLLPLLQAAPHSRVVTVSSIRHRQGEQYGTPWHPLPYDGRTSYATSKLWNLAYALWLDNALQADPSEPECKNIQVADHSGGRRSGA